MHETQHQIYQNGYMAGVRDCRKDMLRMIRKFLDELEADTETED